MGGPTRLRRRARRLLLGRLGGVLSLRAEDDGHPPTAELVAEHYPDVLLKRPLAGDEGLYDCSRAERPLAWRHPVD